MLFLSCKGTTVTRVCIVKNMGLTTTVAVAVSFLCTRTIRTLHICRLRCALYARTL